MELKKFQNICDEFEKIKIRSIIKNSFMDYLKNIDNQYEIYIVSASISNYLKPWCDEMGFKLISTELEICDNKLTGKFSTKNCNGIENANRIRESIQLEKYKEILVFGNSKGDFDMMNLATKNSIIILNNGINKKRKNLYIFIQKLWVIISLFSNNSYQKI